MKDRIKRHIPLLICAVLLLLAANALSIYVQPMPDVSLDLSLVPQEDGMVLDPESFDSKGWSVYTQEGDLRTELTADGFGGFSGLELGQTFYFSRVLDEELDSPTLQLDTIEYTFSVWLDDILLYTDCPALDNRIGHVTLPMNGWFRSDPIIISLPMDYQGKTLTIAQSFPEWSETNRVMAYPTSVRLYCGYAYESGLISETTRTTLLAALAFALTAALLAGFVRNRDWSILCLALVSFLWMVQQLQGTSFYFRYFTSFFNTTNTVLPLVSTLALLSYLTLRGGKHRKWLWGAVVLYALSVISYAAILATSTYFTVESEILFFLSDYLAYWLGFICLVAVLVMGTLWWRKESGYYQVFIPLAYIGIALSWALELASRDELVWKQIIENIASGQALYLYSHTLPGIMVAALITTVEDSVRTELNRLAEQRLIQQRQEMTLSSYENLRSQHEEVMMLRHDMAKHLRTLQSLSDETQVKAYLAELIGQNERIRSTIRTGNQTMDIILGSKISTARSQGITVEIQRAQAPAEIPMTDADLCSMLMNILDNAITAAAKAQEPYILLDVHANNGFLAVICENSFDGSAAKQVFQTNGLQIHGLGLKIVENTVEKYQGVMDTQQKNGRFRMRIVIPLEAPPEVHSV